MLRKTVGVMLVGFTLVLGGCSVSSPELSPVVYSDANIDVLKKDVQDTVCSVSGKRVISEEDVSRFIGLKERLETYEGNEADKVSRVVEVIEDVAVSWESTVGLDLGEKNASDLTRLCTLVKTAV